MRSVVVGKTDKDQSQKLDVSISANDAPTVVVTPQQRRKTREQRLKQLVTAASRRVIPTCQAWNDGHRRRHRARIVLGPHPAFSPPSEDSTTPSSLCRCGDVASNSSCPSVSGPSTASPTPVLSATAHTTMILGDSNAVFDPAIVLISRQAVMPPFQIWPPPEPRPTGVAATANVQPADPAALPLTNHSSSRKDKSGHRIGSHSQRLDGAATMATDMREDQLRRRGLRVSAAAFIPSNSISPPTSSLLHWDPTFSLTGQQPSSSPSNPSSFPPMASNRDDADTTALAAGEDRRAHRFPSQPSSPATGRCSGGIAARGTGTGGAASEFPSLPPPHIRGGMRVGNAGRMTTDGDNVRHTRVTMSDRIAQNEKLLIELLAKDEDEEDELILNHGCSHPSAVPRVGSVDAEADDLVQDEWDVHSTASTASHIWQDRTLGGYWSLSRPRPVTRLLSRNGSSVQNLSSSYQEDTPQHRQQTRTSQGSRPVPGMTVSMLLPVPRSPDLDDLLEGDYCYEDEWEVNSSAYADSLDEAEVQWIEDQLRVSEHPSHDFY